MKALRIAVLSPIAWRTPPVAYGPWEQFASLLAEGLVELGHDVTLFATGNSTTSGHLSATSPIGWEEDPDIEPKVAECIHIASLFERADEFDIIHNSFDFLPLTYSRLVETPVVTTIHGFSSERILEVYRRYDDVGNYVAISDADRDPGLRYVRTIHHGIATDSFAPAVRHGDHLLFFGRIHPDKGTATAIEVARRAGRRLDIAGVIQDRAYFDDEIRPHLDDTTVRYLGVVSADDRSDVLADAGALLHLIDFDEPFGFSVAEALASGTPVIAHRRGSMPELVMDGVDGYLVRGPDDAVHAVEHAGHLDRNVIRQRAIDRFGVQRMVHEYADLYHATLAGNDL